jgi:hypothetical protein
MHTDASNDTVTTLIPPWQGTSHRHMANASAELKTT